MNLAHIDKNNNPTIVDIESKEITKRYAKARVSIIILPESGSLLSQDNELNVKKGPVFQTAIIAGTMAYFKSSSFLSSS